MVAVAIAETETATETETAAETATETATATVTATETPEATSTPVPDNATGEQNPLLTEVANTEVAAATNIAQSLIETDSVASPIDATLSATIETSSTNSSGNLLTSTPLPTFTDMPSATETPTETKVPTRTKTPTPQPQATFTPTQTGQAQAKTPTGAALVGIPDITVQLVAPNEGDTVQGRFTFSWKASAPLPSGYAFEPVFVAKGGNLENGQGFGGTTTQTELSLDLTKHIQGQLVWGVRLVIQKPYKPLKLVSDTRMINVHIPDTQPNNGGGNENPGPVDPNRP